MANYAKKKKNKSKESAGMQTTDYILSIMCSMYVFCMLCIYPLYYENKYFNMGDAKYHFFKYVSVFFLVAMLFTVVAWLAARRKEMNFAIIARTFSYPDWFAVGFFVFSYFSFVLSEYKETAFYGYDGWYMGMMSQFAFVIIYFLVSRFWRWSPTTLLFALGTAAITYQLGIWQRFLIDPLGMYIDLGPEYIEKFVSTLGQTTWFSSYAVLIFPIGMFYYCYDEKKWARIFAGIFLALGYGMLATTNSDSAYVAFILILMAFFWFALESNQTFGRFLEAVLIGLASFRVIGICRLLFPEKQITLITGDEAITAFVTGSGLMLFLLVAVAVLYGVYRYVCKVNKEFSVRKFVFLRSVMVWAAVLAVWLKSLRKPCGLLAACDDRSFEILDVCREVKIKVPAEIGIIGVNNDPILCENTEPRLSSIQPDFVGEGRLAAELLERIMAGYDLLDRERFRKVGIRTIVHRESTTSYSKTGRLVQKILAYINTEALSGIGVEDVAARFKVSRSLLELRFRELQDESVYEAILRIRLEEVKRRLRQTNETISEITAACGWKNPTPPKALFKKRFGISMREYRKQKRV